MTGVIARREAAALFGAAQTWLVLAALAALSGFLFLRALEGWLGVQDGLALADHSPGLAGFLAVRFLAPFSAVLAVVAPLFAMRAFSDEYRHATFALWRSSPVPTLSLVLGKFLGALAVPLLLVALVVATVLAMRGFVRLDTGVLASSALGLALAASAYVAAGLWFSSLTRHATLAVLGALTFLLVLWLLGHAPLTGASGALARALAVGERLGGFFQGYPRTGDAAYFVLMTIAFLALTVIRVEARSRATER